MGRRAILCPKCRRIVGSEETSCSWCGTSRSNPLWHLVQTVQGPSWAQGICWGIIAINLLFYLLALLLSAKLDFNGALHLAPGRNSLFMLGATGTFPIDRYGRIWSLITANYLHGGLLHLLFNMMALRQLAVWVAVEYGTSRMIILYTGGGIAGYLMSYVAGVPFTIGASAAVCSLIGALLYYGKSRGGAYGTSVYREVGGWAVGLFLFGFIVPGINNWAHGGGMLGGILLGMVLGYQEKRADHPADQLMAVACTAITLLALGWALFGARV